MKGQGVLVFKLNPYQFGLYVRKKFFTVRMAKHLYRLPGKVAVVQLLALVQVRFDGTLRDLI